MRQIALGSVMAVALCASSLPVQSEDTHPYSILLHITSASFSGCNETDLRDESLGCDMIVTEGELQGPNMPQYAWLLVGGVPTLDAEWGGIGQLRFGIDYEPTVLVGWALCTGGTETPQADTDGLWPARKTGNLVTWPDQCRQVTANPDGLTKVGFFAIPWGNYGGIWITEDPRTSKAEAVDCRGNTVRICRQLLGKIVVLEPADGPCDAHGHGYAVQVCNPCGFDCTVPVETSTWGRIKSQYR